MLFFFFFKGLFVWLVLLELLQFIEMEAVFIAVVTLASQADTFCKRVFSLCFLINWMCGLVAFQAVPCTLHGGSHFVEKRRKEKKKKKNKRGAET